MWLACTKPSRRLLSLLISSRTQIDTSKWVQKFRKEHCLLVRQELERLFWLELAQDRQECRSFTYLVVNLLRNMWEWVQIECEAYSMQQLSPPPVSSLSIRSMQLARKETPALLQTRRRKIR